MGKIIKKANFWVRRRSHLPILIIGSVCILLLYFNEDASMSLNMEYEKRINELKAEIKENQDSMLYYRSHRMAIEQGKADLEYMAREQFHMQRPSEDVYLLPDDKK